MMGTLQNLRTRISEWLVRHRHNAEDKEHEEIRVLLARFFVCFAVSRVFAPVNGYDFSKQYSASSVRTNICPSETTGVAMILSEKSWDDRTSQRSRQVSVAGLPPC